MSGARRVGEELHPVVAAAAEGRLPEWAPVGEKRLAHMRRVAGLLDAWAAGLGLENGERARWRSVGYLHDCLKEVPPTELARLLDGAFVDLPDPVVHGPAAAARLTAEGVTDEELLDAIRYHTLGHARLGTLGRALYAADFLEPGRDLRNDWREALRERMPGALEDVVREIVRARIVYLVEGGRPVRSETTAFWNALTQAGERREGWVRASEL